MSKIEDLFYIYIKRKAQTITKFYNIPYEDSQKLVRGIITDTIDTLNSIANNRAKNKEEEK